MKYIGFDFDKCLAETYTLMPIIDFLEKILPATYATADEAIKEALISQKNKFYEILASNEVGTGGTIIRPSFLKVLPDLLKRRNSGDIDHLFIYSNNESQHLVDTVDHILALALERLSVPRDHLVTEKDGILQTFTPRICKNADCRSGEVGGFFKEKTFEGIETCLETSMAETDLVYFDDTSDHTALINSLGLDRGYFVVKPYNVTFKNEQIAQFILQAFSPDVFEVETPTGAIFMRAYGLLEKKFVKYERGRGYLLRERSSLYEPLLKSLRAISTGRGRAKRRWTASDTQADVARIQMALIHAKAETRGQIITPRILSTAAAYGQPLSVVGGRRQRHTRHTRRQKRQRRQKRTRHQRH